MHLLQLSPLALCLVLCGCPDRTDSPPPAPDTVAQLQVKDGVGLLFSFYDNRAEMRTVDRIGEVAETARSDVWVTDPQKHLPGDLIYVTDLSKKSRSGYRVWVEPKGKWLDRVVPKVSVSEALAQNEPAPAPKAKKRARRPHRQRPRVRPRPAPQAGSAEPAAQPQATPKVFLFSTNWCPSCRAARAFFQEKRVPFRELDVERDPQAQQAYLGLQQRFGLKRGVIPVIVVGERVFQGFSRPQIEAALAALARGS
jgi:glutaredoxin 3